jgi:hypothetical protein
MWSVFGGEREREREKLDGTVSYVDLEPVSHTRRPMSAVLNRINHRSLTQKGP